MLEGARGKYEGVKKKASEKDADILKLKVERDEARLLSEQTSSA